MPFEALILRHAAGASASVRDVDVAEAAAAVPATVRKPRGRSSHVRKEVELEVLRTSSPAQVAR
jgi:hypothetical protein